MQTNRLDVLEESLIGVEQDGLSALTEAMLRANANHLNSIGSVSVNGSHESERETAGT